MKIRATFPLYPLLRIDTDFHVETYQQFIRYFETPRRLPVRGTENHNGELLTAHVAPCSTAFKKRYMTNSAHMSMRADHMLEFTGTFRFPGTKKFFLKDHDGNIVPHTKSDLHAMWREWLPDDLDLTIQTYFAALMIAFPGAVRPVHNVWLLGGTQDSTNQHYVSTFHESVEHLTNHGMLPRTGLDPDKIVRWAFAQNGIFDGYGDTPSAKALNFFTRIFVSDFRNDELSNLIWALGGIESLLVQGGRSSIGQLKEKLAALFNGEQALPWILKTTEKMYNYRSRMIHGDRPIRSAFRLHESEESDKRFDEEYHSELFAVGLLLVLIQYVAERNIPKIQFKTIIDESL